MRRLAAALGALALVLAGCGYSVAAGLKLRGGAPDAAVRPFENRSVDPGAGAAVAASIRDELARRGALGGDGSRAVIDGEAWTEGGAPTLPGGATLHLAIRVRARLAVDGAVVAERTVRHETDYLGGADALEGEARRAQALRRIAAEAARELVGAFEE